MKTAAALLCLLFPLAACASDIKLPVHYATLKNGLRIIVVPDTDVAVVSCRIYYFVGSMNESTGHTGLSHMYEHMMFKGTKILGTTGYAAEAPLMAAIDSLDRLICLREQPSGGAADSLTAQYRKQQAALLDKQRKYIKKDEIWELYQNNGATNLNAWTADDMTAYIVTLPRNKVELFYWIESDRMRTPVLREFTSERDVVMEERRMRYDNRPLGRYWEKLNALFYIADPYRNPTIGWASDIRAYTREKLERHISRYYTPDNALVVLAGSIDPLRAVKDLERYFGAIPRAAREREEIVTREPSPLGETRFTLYDDAAPRIDMLFHAPGYPDDVLYKMAIVEGIFSGRSGRLYRRLVDREGLCTDIGASHNPRLRSSYFQIWAELKDNADPSKVERIIREEIAKAAEAPPTAVEIRRIANEIRMDFVSGIKSLEGLSDHLAWFERLGSWSDLLTYPERIAAVKPAEIPAAVARYLDPGRMTIGLMLQKPADVPKSKTAPRGAH
ncbi:MAG: insulinase family protein [Chitinispirillaceae bacterium]|nr:insulinase family protein [Chitinispirillaceae bacterium]